MEVLTEPLRSEAVPRPRKGPRRSRNLERLQPVRHFPTKRTSAQGLCCLQQQRGRWCQAPCIVCVRHVLQQSTRVHQDASKCTTRRSTIVPNAMCIIVCYVYMYLLCLSLFVHVQYRTNILHRLYLMYTIVATYL